METPAPARVGGAPLPHKPTVTTAFFGVTSHPPLGSSWFQTQRWNLGGFHSQVVTAGNLTWFHVVCHVHGGSGSGFPLLLFLCTLLAVLLWSRGRASTRRGPPTDLWKRHMCTLCCLSAESPTELSSAVLLTAGLPRSVEVSDVSHSLPIWDHVVCLRPRARARWCVATRRFRRWRWLAGEQRCAIMVVRAGPGGHQSITAGSSPTLHLHPPPSTCSWRDTLLFDLDQAAQTTHSN